MPCESIELKIAHIIPIINVLGALFSAEFSAESFNLFSAEFSAECLIFLLRWMELLCEYLNHVVKASCLLK